MLIKASAAAFGLLLALTGAAPAQSYPTKPLTMIIPFAAGGPTDVLGRVIAQRMSEVLGQQVVVENVGGAGGMTGANRVAKAVPDGYTVLLSGSATLAQNPSFYKRPLYNPTADFEHAALFSDSARVLIARKDLPPKTLAEFVAYAKTHQTTMQYGSAGAGSGSHVCAILLDGAMGTKITHVPYRGAGPAMQDLIAGHVDLFCGEASQALSAARAGQVKGLVAMSEERWSLLPDVSTMKEIGLDTTIPFWHGLWAPKGTPKEVVDKLNAAAVAAFSDPAIQKRIADLGQVIPPKEGLTPTSLGAWHKAEIDKWWPFIKAQNIRVSQ